MSQFHKFFKPSLGDTINTALHRFKGVNMAAGSFVLSKAKILRFPKKVSIGRNTIIKPYAEICACNSSANILIGEETTIGNFTFIYSSASVVVGNKCLIAPFVYIVDSDHGIKRGTPIREQANKVEPVIIGDDVWIGTNSIITSGCQIGKGSVIAANSVVKDNVGEYEIWAGVPAKKVGERK